MNKEELEKRINKLLKLRKLFFILSTCLLGIAVSADLTLLILYLAKIEVSDLVMYLLVEISSFFFAGSIALFFVRIFAIDTKLRNAAFQLAQQNPNVNVVDLGTVDVKAKPEEKPVDPKQQLVDQYEDLLKRGYITQEEFEAKKKEILG